tara:strand:+ start:121 stop:315 length:195 start_codon:yes stop_codon:yes gene_type:complete
MATREEVRRTDNSKLGRAVLNNRSSVMRGLRDKVDVVAETKKFKKIDSVKKVTEKKTKKSEKKG